ERIEVAVEIEALRKDDLEDVAREDVLARRFDRGLEQTARHGRRERRQLVHLLRWRRRRQIRERPRELIDARVESGLRKVVRHAGVVRARARYDEHVLDEEEALPEV